MSDILKGLNDEQREAVLHLDGALLILAGAGSGKTKTLTTRLAYLIDEIGIPPSSTLTLTFTNKAASEMRYRALSLIKNNSSLLPLLCTFHKFGLLFLKFNMSYLNRSTNFILLDNDDKKRILKLFNKNIPISMLSSEISRMKNWLITPDEAYIKAQDNIYKNIAKIYASYNKYLLEKNMVDFDDLLLLSYEILDKNLSLCKEVSAKYSYIMVDEYQDTNELQYKILKKLTLEHSNICVVGDDDQSIYGWRGANINNILDFEDNFVDSKIIKLEKNYRSTSQILDVANKLINFNIRRLGKELKSIKGNGKDVELLEFLDERIEAINIANRIRKLLDNGVSASKIAILFRLNALSRSIEDGLNKANIPYRLIGAMRFYERAEIKDILSYFRLVVNPNDDFSFLRIVNRPKRGIGKVTQDKLEQFIQEKQISIYKAINEYKNEIPLQAKHISIITSIFDMINELRETLEDSTIGFLDLFKDSINILDTFENIQDEIDREANIDEFYGFFRDYIIQNPTASLEDFLNDISLNSDDENDINNLISCMSIHSSKGLEFDYLFVIGLEDGFCPIISDNTDIEEERRLGYVAFTRAKNELVLSYVKSRYYKGKRTQLQPSKFLSECGLIGRSINLDKTKGFKNNDLVIHKVFGAGRVISVSDSGRDSKLRINFGGVVRDILSSFVIKA
ncbi:ATP-dependent helicase [Helicobacter sp. MIT 14-3879]|uniref:ATP-dependent helicase n=1 Tax=Helicobacter sp. MIT 14-3879 TaxID=2040649 RepID=UPI000E1F658D|nr:UvrD-helicase domain-containing protein [Helicobacter sp. MIT 14-3879]RDU62874.1 ATP-dependent DNA helicase [Helicobacter sp. MIT 14-3879]